MDSKQCGHLLGDLAVYLDGEASEALCLEIERHLEECTDCRVVVDTLRKTVELVRELPQPGLPEETRERLYTTLDLTDEFRPRP